MTHRAEQIMQAVVAAVTGLATSGNNVHRGREYALPSNSKLPALLVYMGSDEPLRDDSAWPRMYSDLNVEVAIARSIEPNYEAQLLASRAEVTQALRADYTLGLPFVQEIQERAADEPDYEGDPPRVVFYRLPWAVRYWRPWDDPGA